MTSEIVRTYRVSIVLVCRTLACTAFASAALACTALAYTALAPEMPAQGAGDARGITLRQALDAVLEHGTQLQLGERQVQMGEGALLTARAPFDARVVTSFSTERSNSLAPGADAGVSAILTSTVASSIALPKQFRFGVAVVPHVDIVRAAVDDVPGTPTSSASVGLDVTVPLLRDRGGGVTAAPERAARRSLDAALLDARHSAAASVLATVLAYWSELAAEQRVEVYRSSEERARQLVEDTRRLVEADERPAADLQQLRANLALKRAARLAGEQSSVEAREQLALAMGVQVDDMAALPRAISGFPTVRATESPVLHDGATGAAEAMSQRADLAALRADRTAAELQWRAARAGLRPRLDLTATVGYQGVTAAHGFGESFSSFYRNVPGLDASVRLSYELPLASLAARGEALRTRAAYEQTRIREAELARQISSGVRVAREALSHGRGALLAAREAVALSRQAVENEKRKFQLGMSTLFDVILAEDALTNARLSEIAGQQAYAVAIARLRYETGAIVSTDSGTLTVNAASLESEP
ncbi:MAG TPA: TolC family protein [Gemmatimonadaceae bacterium]|nr:TolC family protein [Gemmatimonadaceae bacterium]